MGCFVVVCFFSLFFHFYFFLTLKLWCSNTLIDHMIYLKCCYILVIVLYFVYLFFTLVAFLELRWFGHVLGRDIGYTGQNMLMMKMSGTEVDYREDFQNQL